MFTFLTPTIHNEAGFLEKVKMYKELNFNGGKKKNPKSSLIPKQKQWDQMDFNPLDKRF